MNRCRAPLALAPSELPEPIDTKPPDDEDDVPAWTTNPLPAPDLLAPTTTLTEPARPPVASPLSINTQPELPEDEPPVDKSIEPETPTDETNPLVIESDPDDQDVLVPDTTVTAPPLPSTEL